MHPARTRPRRRGAASAAGLAVLSAALLSACGSATPPAAPPPAVGAPASAPAPPSGAAPTSPARPPGPRTCNASLDAGSGRYSITGPDAGRISSSDAGLLFGCGDGPTVQAQIDPGSSLVLRFQGRTTRLGNGQSATVGPYRITVTSLRDKTAGFRFVVTGAPG